MTEPLVSVIIPCFNYGSLVEGAVQSALQSHYSNVEVVVVNDGSTDNSQEVLDAIAALDSRVTVIHTENRGVEAARNLAIANSKGDYIFTIDADDTFKPTFIPIAVNVLLTQPDVIFVHSDTEFIGRVHRIATGEEFNIRRFLLDNYIGNCGLIRRSAFDKTPYGYITGAHLNTHEDWIFLMELLITGGKFFRIPEPLYVYLLKPDSKLQIVTRNKPLLAKVYEYVFPIQLKLLRQFVSKGQLSVSAKNEILGELEHKLAYFNLNYANFFWGFCLACSSTVHKPVLFMKNIRIILSGAIKRIISKG